MILSNTIFDGKTVTIAKNDNTRLIVNYSDARAAKDAYNRIKGLNRLEIQIKRGRLTKANINQRGYNKYLSIRGDLAIKIDYDKYMKDKAWDGLKGYITNTKLSVQEVIDNYSNLWHIEKAFYGKHIVMQSNLHQILEAA